MASDLDFIRAMTDDTRRREDAEAFLGKLKTANPLMTAVQYAQRHPMEAIGAAIGAGVFTGAQYLAFRKQDGGPSAEQMATTKAVDEAKIQEHIAKKTGRPLGFGSRFRNALARGGQEMADVGADHPIRTALVAGVPTGAAAGALIARALRR